MDTDNYFPEDKLEVGDKVVIRGDKEKKYRTITKVYNLSTPLYMVEGSAKTYSIEAFYNIRRASRTSHTEPQAIEPKQIYSLENLPMYESTLVPKFGHVLRLPEGYVFANPVTFIPTKPKEIL